MARHPEVPFWLCVGDLATDTGAYEPVGALVYWIHGNNDNFDAIAAGDLPTDLIHIPNGTSIDIARGGAKAPALQAAPLDVGHGVSRAVARQAAPSDVGGGAKTHALQAAPSEVGHGFSRAIVVAGIGGTFAPTWYESKADDLPHPKKKATAKATSHHARGATPRAPKDDKRRHFVREEVEACARLRGVDVFMSHEAARPFRAFPGGRGPDAGKQPINDVLAAMQPRLHLFGHHHRFSDQVREGVRSIGLDLVTRGYLLIDAATLQIEPHTLKY